MRDHYVRLLAVILYVASLGIASFGAGGCAEAGAGAGVGALPDAQVRSFYYGSALGADKLGNTVVGGPYDNAVSYRFRAQHSGPLRDIRVYLIPDRSGYAAGTGGKIQVTLRPDDQSPAHTPSNTILASYLIETPLASVSPTRYFPTLTFPNGPDLSAGELYHIVFSNVDATSNRNYLSVDGLYEANGTTSGQPCVSSLDWGMLVQQDGHDWKTKYGYTPIMELDYQDGWSDGIGYIEAWSGSPEAISGSHSVRETFTVSGPSRNVQSVVVRVARVAGSGPLDILLTSAGNTTIARCTVPTDETPLQSPPAYMWTRCTFSSSQIIMTGQTYHLALAAPATSAYQAFPIRKGYAYGFKDTTFFPSGTAQFTDGGAWTGWTEWGVANRADSDLQFYFSLAP